MMTEFNQDSATSPTPLLRINTSALVPVFFAFTGAMALAAAGQLSDGGRLTNTYSSLVGGIGIVLSAIAVVMLSVLFIKGPGSLRLDDVTSRRSGGAGLKRSAIEIATGENIAERIERLEASAKAFEKASTAQREAIAADVLEEVNHANSEQLIARAQARLESQLGRESARDYVRDAFAGTVSRLNQERRRLLWSGTYNLAIGGMVSLAGIGLLAYYLFYEQHAPLGNSTMGLTVHYASRLGLVILIEGFSIFFLNLYKASLDDIRYYQNELTNIEQRLVAFEVLAGFEGCRLEDFAKTASATERNFSLKKGESTIGLEKAKIEANAGVVELLKAVAPAIRKHDATGS